MYSWEWLGGNIEIHELKLVNFVSSSPVLTTSYDEWSYYDGAGLSRLMDGSRGLDPSKTCLVGCLLSGYPTSTNLNSCHLNV